MWLKTYEALEPEEIEVKLANPSKTRIIPEAKTKTDKFDAMALSNLLREDPHSRVLRTFQGCNVVEDTTRSQGQHRERDHNKKQNP
jgi:hypothetical protein